MKVITFSLWGTDFKYLIGAIRNAELARQIYPDWVCRFYVSELLPIGILETLRDLENVQVIEMPFKGDWRSMFWRFTAIDDEDVEVMISRDADSRLSHREKAAVDEWLASDKGFHIMRDHPYHGFPVLGGMWGIKKGTIPSMTQLVEAWDQKDEYGTDYKFFAASVMPLVEDNKLVHDEFFENTPFPTPREGHDFVGQIFDESDNPVSEHVDILKRHLSESR